MRRLSRVAGKSFLPGHPANALIHATYSFR
jgi:hypothetical protein